MSQTARPGAQEGPRPGQLSPQSLRPWAMRTTGIRAVAQGCLHTAASAVPSLSRARSIFKAKNFNLLIESDFNSLSDPW